MTFAAHDLKYVQLPVGWDATYLSNFSMADGMTFDRIVSDIEGALSLYNGETPWYNDFISVAGDDEIAVEYPQGTLVTEAHSEYTPPKGQRPDFTGHMLPVLERDLGFRFTYDFLKKGRMSRVDGTIRAGLDAFRQWDEYLIVRRALRRADDTGEANGLGAGGLSPGFAAPAANTGVDFQPPRFGGESFDTNHTHYLGYAAANLAVGLSAMINHLREHGHPAPYELWISTENVATVTALTNFVGIQPVTQIFPADVERVTRNPTTPMGSVPYYVGSYGDGQGADAWIRVVPRVPQNYYWMGKPYGFGDARNPFRVRFDRRWGPPGLMLIATKMNYPLDDAYLFQAKGVGVGEDRTNGVAMFIDAGAAWAEATVPQ